MKKRWRKISPGRSGWCWQKAAVLILSKCRWMKTDERLSRLDWSAAQRTSLVTAMIETGVGIPSMCLSAHRRFPFGSRDEAVRERAREIMSKAIRLARDLGIRTIQLAGYDVYYEDHDEGTRQRFAEGLAWAVEQAAASQVMLAVEIMDTAFMNSISKWKKWDEMLASPWFTVYPDVGNLSAWGNDVPAELKLGIDRIARDPPERHPASHRAKVPDSSATCRLAKAASISLASSKRCIN